MRLTHRIDTTPRERHHVHTMCRHPLTRLSRVRYPLPSSHVIYYPTSKRVVLPLGVYPLLTYSNYLMPG
jgi:hypothetical protein